MAGTDKTVKLNLEITATDKAKDVFEKFVVNLKESLDKVKVAVDEALGGNTLGQEMTQQVTRMNEALDRLNVSQFDEAINRLQATTESSMSGVASSVERMESTLRHSLDQASQIADSTNQHIERIGKNVNYDELQNVGMQMQMLGERITGFYVEAIKSAADFDQNIVNTTASINANRGATKLATNQIDAMRNKALALGSAGFFSANQIGEAMNTMAKSGRSYNQIMQGGIDTVYQVAVANQQNLEETATVVSDIYAEMGDEFSKQGLNAQQAAQQIGNSMTVALHHARLSMNDFLKTMKYVGPQASAAGIGIKDVSTMIAVLGQHGLNSSQAGTTLRRMLTNLTPSSAKAAALMEKLGLDTKKTGNIFYDTATGKMKPLAQVQQILHDKLTKLSPEMEQLAIKTIFGQYALSGMTAIVNTAPSKIDKLTKAMNNNGLMQEIIATKAKGMKMVLQKLSAEYQTLQKAIGEQLKPIVTWLANFIGNLMERFYKLSPSVQNLIAKIGVFTGVGLLLGGVVLGLIGTLGLFVMGLSTVAETIGLLAAPFGIIIGVIVGVGLAAVGLYKLWQHNFGGIQQKTKAVWDWIKNEFNAAMNFIVPKISAGVREIVRWWHQIEPDFVKALHNVYAAIMWLTPLWKGLWDVIKFAAKLALDWVVSIVQGFWNVFHGIFDLIVHILSGDWGKVWGDIGTILKGAVELLLNLFGGFGGRFIGKLVEILGKFKWFGKGGGDAMKALGEAIIKISDAFMKRVASIFKSAFGIFKALFNGWKNTAVGIFNLIKDLLSGNLKGAWREFGKLIGEGIRTAYSVLRGLLRIFNDVMGGIPGKMYSWGRSIVSYLGRGLRALGSMAYGEARNVVNSLSNVLQHVLPRNMYEWASNAINMFVSGISRGIGKVRSVVSNVAHSISQFLGFHSPTKEGAASDSDTWMPNMIKMFTEGIHNNKDKLQLAVGGLALGVQQQFMQAHHTVQQAVSTPSIPSTVHNNQRQQVIQINIDGRSAKTDKDLANQIANEFRKQMPMITA